MKTKLLKLLSAFSIINLIILNACSSNTNSNAAQNNSQWINELNTTKWVCYNPPNSNPHENRDASVDDILIDLDTLINNGFTGIVTYGAKGVLGKELPLIAQEKGLKLILGIWDLKNEEERKNAVEASALKAVVAICVGNEGLNERYDIDALLSYIDKIKKETKKPVTTSEQIEDYKDTLLLKAGDFLFPIIHPYFNGYTHAETAALWVYNKYEELKNISSLPVLVKETAFPTAGDNNVSENLQYDFYMALAEKNVNFCYFEAYDQPWKQHLPVEPHWGLFTEKRQPKKIMKFKFQSPYTPIASMPENKPAVKIKTFYVYKDAGYAGNNFYPTGYMGDCGDIVVQETCTEEPFKGSTCIKFTYKAKGLGPNTCNYNPPCKWSGCYWLRYNDYWGTGQKKVGFDLSLYKKLKFAAKASRNSQIEFKVGGIDQKYGDSQNYGVSIKPTLSTEWKEYEIDLSKANLKNIIGGFCLSTNFNDNPSGVVIYIDEIRYEE